MNTKLLPVAIAIAALLSACSTSTVRSQSGQEATSADSVILAGQPAASIGQFPGATIKGSSADANARHQYVVTAMDVAGKLGFVQISIATVNDPTTP